MSREDMPIVSTTLHKFTDSKLIPPVPQTLVQPLRTFIRHEMLQNLSYLEQYRGQGQAVNTQLQYLEQYRGQGQVANTQL